MENRVGVIKGDQVLAHKCYQAVLALKENHMWLIEEKSPETVETLKTIELVEGEPTKVINIGANHDLVMKKRDSGVLEKKSRCLCVEP